MRREGPLDHKHKQDQEVEVEVDSLRSKPHFYFLSSKPLLENQAQPPRLSLPINWCTIASLIELLFYFS